MKDFLETIVKSILGSDEYTIEEDDKKFEVKYTVMAKGDGDSSDRCSRSQDNT